VGNFDAVYTKDSAALSPIEPSVLAKAGVNQEDFVGFSYVADHFLDDTLKLGALRL
jgi:hypothetical protein